MLTNPKSTRLWIAVALLMVVSSCSKDLGGDTLDQGYRRLTAASSFRVQFRSKTVGPADDNLGGVKANLARSNRLSRGRVTLEVMTGTKSLVRNYVYDESTTLVFVPEERRARTEGREFVRVTESITNRIHPPFTAGDDPTGLLALLRDHRKDASFLGTRLIRGQRATGFRVLLDVPSSTDPKPRADVKAWFDKRGRPWTITIDQTGSDSDFRTSGTYEFSGYEKLIEISWPNANQIFEPPDEETALTLIEPSTEN